MIHFVDFHHLQHVTRATAPITDLKTHLSYAQNMLFVFNQFFHTNRVLTAKIISKDLKHICSQIEK